MKTSEGIDRAADLIKERGWAQGGSGHGDDGSLCVINACAHVWREVGGASGWMTATDRIKDYLGLTHDLQGWNDAPERTADEVIATLRAAAVIEAAKEQAASLDVGVVAAEVSGR